MAKTCGHCQSEVPRDAKACRYCGAAFIKMNDSSFFGKIIGAVKGAFIGGIALCFIGGMSGAPTSEATGFAVVGAIIGAVVGFMVGHNYETTSR